MGRFPKPKSRQSTLYLPHPAGIRRRSVLLCLHLDIRKQRFLNESTLGPSRTVLPRLTHQLVVEFNIGPHVYSDTLSTHACQPSRECMACPGCKSPPRNPRRIAGPDPNRNRNRSLDRRYFDIARGSGLECAAYPDVLVGKQRLDQADSGKAIGCELSRCGWGSSEAPLPVASMRIQRITVPAELDRAITSTSTSTSTSTIRNTPPRKWYAPACAPQCGRSGGGVRARGW